MGDPQEVKLKGQYKTWSGPEHRLLLRSVVDAINQGFRDAEGKFNKLTVETRILSILREQLGSKKTYEQYKNRMKILKGRYQVLTDFLRCNSGFGWDSETKKFTADDEVWNVFLQANPSKRHLRDDSYEDFDELRMIFGQNTAAEKNAVALGDTIGAVNSQVEDIEMADDISLVEMVNDAEGIIHQQASDYGVFSSTEKHTGDKLPLRKKAKTGSHLEKVNEVTEMSSQILGMIQKRWEKEAEEKEIEDKANNVWDAIQEIPDLEEDLRYEAMTLVHSLGMKSGFVNMGVADRCGWIKRNLRKP